MQSNNELKQLQSIESWEDRYLFLLELGDKLPKLESNQKTEQNRVQGCQSRVWLVLQWQDELEPKSVTKKVLKIDIEADSRMVSGLLYLTKIVYQGKTKEEINQTNVDWIKTSDLDKNISLTRLTGLNAVIKRIHEFASIQD